MDDAKLLGLAAKAVGAVSLPNDRLHSRCSSNGPSYTSPWSLNGDMWQPLISDADAFQLMVHCGMQTDVLANMTRVNIVAYEISIIEHVREKLSIKGAQNSAETTRRAIVRAAAAIGSLMP